MSNSPGGVTPQPPSFEKRLPLALALMMLVLLASQYIFKPAPGPKPAVPIDDKSAANLVSKPAPGAASQTLPNTGAPTAGAIQASSEVTTDIDTNLYHIVFTNQGATVKSWVLKQYRDDAGKPLQLINTAGTDVPRPFSIEAANGQKLSIDPNAVLYQPKVSADHDAIEYQFSNGQTTIRKSFQFGNNSYLATIKSEVLVNNSPMPHFLMWRGGFGDQKVRNAAATENTVRYDAAAGKLIKKNTKDAKSGPITDSGNYTFGGLEDNFFAAVVLPVSS